MPSPEKNTSLLVQVDLDSLWAVKEVYGLPPSPEELEHDPLFEESMRFFLDAFARRGIRATFFAIGRDCEAPAKRALLRHAAAQGHEIACHSHSHRIGLGLLPPAEIDAEITRAANAVETATGTRPAGFRAPGFDASAPVLAAVAHAGFAYDSSLLPTRVGAALRLASRLLSKGGGSGSTRGHYGSGPVWKAPRYPYRPDLRQPWRPLATPAAGTSTNDAAPQPPGDKPPLLEIPVSVTPCFLRLPVHASIGIALGWTISGWMLRHLKAARPPVIVYALHCADVTDAGKLLGLASGGLGGRLFHETVDKKRAFVERALDLLLDGARPLTTLEYVREINAS